MNKDIAIRKIIYQQLDRSPITSNRLRLWSLATAGIGLNGYDLFIMSTALPLVQVYFGFSSTGMVGLLAGSAVLGAVPGALISGLLSDRFGRRFILCIDIFLFAITSILCAMAWNPISLVFFRFLQGVAIGAEYPISSALIAEAMPQRTRGKWMTAAFSFQAVGMMLGAAISTLILFLFPREDAWRWMLLSGAIPAFILAWMRRSVRESSRWLARKGRFEESLASLEWLLGSQTACLVRDQMATAEASEDTEPTQGRFSELFQRAFRTRTILTAIPWFLMDIGLYGIGLFTPAILLSVMHGPAIYTHGFLASDFKADVGSTIADLFLMIGFALNILAVESLGRIKLQIVGFLGMAIGTGIVAVFAVNGGSVGLIVGFIIFNMMVNFGPNATTYLLPVEVFPTRLRSTGHGFAAAFGKAGATVGVFFLPIAAHTFGLAQTITVIGILSLIGAIVTLLCRVETRGLALE